ncbi:oxysterol-binding protein-related protein 5 [Orycteropus afer afer]|uniref:Oxysterol-binding protein n=1 Tax=Orycteropus afer afer TaxID=1230840 RepID=A0A8B7AJ37_ORYAF|nr:oxysterol-binding protein-related protein 5 [Orycteropus afer afer]
MATYSRPLPCFGNYDKLFSSANKSTLPASRGPKGRDRSEDGDESGGSVMVPVVVVVVVVLLMKQPGSRQHTQLLCGYGLDLVLHRDPLQGGRRPPAPARAEPSAMALSILSEQFCIRRPRKAEYRLYNGSDKECVSPTAKVTKKETLKAQKENYRQEKKRATKQLFSALTDPSVVIMADSLKGPKGESVGSITQPLPSSYLIFRAASESDGRCWLDALELALRCSSLLRLGACKQTCDSEPSSSPDTSPSALYRLPGSADNHPERDLFPLNGSSLVSHLENDAFSDKSEKENAEESDNEAQDHRRKTPESGSDQSEPRGSPARNGTTYVEQACEELGEVGEAAQVETVSEENRSLMWVLLRQLRPGMDLSRVVLPTFVLEPRSFLNKLSDYYYHADLLSRATLEEDAYGRMKHVLRWYLSGFYKKPKGIKKPYNPILGEIFRCRWFHPQTDSHTFYIAEQVSHHPPVSAFHISNRKDGFCIGGSITARSKFYGNSLTALLDGKATLTFLNRAEDYTITMPYAHCKGILYGTMTMELGGKVTIECEKNNLQAELEFKLKPFFRGSTSINQISGRITAGEEVLARVSGRWDREVFVTEEGRVGAELLWNPAGEVRAQRLKRHTVLLEQQTELESERLWQHVTRAICEGDQHRATQEKFVLEEAQRRRALERQQTLTPWTPRLFHLDPATQEWHYLYEDRSPWDPEKDLLQFEENGILHTLRRTAVARLTPFLHSPGPRRKGPGPEHRLRKASDQPSGHSQATESSGSTPESCPELSDEDGDFQPGCGSPCPRCGKEARRLQALHEAVLSVREVQQDLHRHLSAMLSCTVQAAPPPAPRFLQSPRSWVLLCVLLACQLLINSILK